MVLTNKTAILSVGCGSGGVTLGMAALQQFPPATATPLATSRMVTAACLFGGLVQPLVGAALGAPHRSGDMLNLLQAANPDFGTYHRGLLWLLPGVVCGMIASFRFRPAPGSNPSCQED